MFKVRLYGTSFKCFQCFLNFSLSGVVVSAMMIKKMKVKNFPSLRNVSIEVSKLNVFVGPNASGKVI